MSTGSLCCNCESEVVAFECVECSPNSFLCIGCDASLHTNKRIRHHARSAWIPPASSINPDAVTGFCSNCDEQKEARWRCRQCGDIDGTELLCDDCDACLHVHKAKRTHQREPFVRAAQSHQLCANCDEELAVWRCDACGSALFCTGCDSALHTSKTIRHHVRAPYIHASAPPPPPPKMCDNCDEPVPATVVCTDCNDSFSHFCSSCDAALHTDKRIRGHSRRPLSGSSTSIAPQAATATPAKVSTPASSPLPSAALAAARSPVPAASVSAGSAASLAKQFQQSLNLPPAPSHSPTNAQSVTASVKPIAVLSSEQNFQPTQPQSLSAPQQRPVSSEPELLPQVQQPFTFAKPAAGFAWPHHAQSGFATSYPSFNPVQSSFPALSTLAQGPSGQMPAWYQSGGMFSPQPTSFSAQPQPQAQPAVSQPVQLAESNPKSELSFKANVNAPTFAPASFSFAQPALQPAIQPAMPVVVIPAVQASPVPVPVEIQQPAAVHMPNAHVELVLAAGAADEKQEEAAAAPMVAAPKAASGVVAQQSELEEVQPADYTGVFHGKHDWEEMDLPTMLETNIKRLRGFARPSSIQCDSYPVIMSDPPRGVIAEAPAGSGKTLAFSLGALSRVLQGLKQGNNGLQVIMVSNTREVARQTAVVVKTLVHNTPIRVSVAIPRAKKNGYEETDPDLEELMRVPADGAHVLIGTLGTLKNMGTNAKLSPHFVRVHMLVVDEVDQVLIDERARPIRLNPDADSLRRALPQLRQVLCFSATFNDEKRAIITRFATVSGQEPGNVVVADEKRLLSNISQFWIDCRRMEKYTVLKTLAENGLTELGQCIIFSNSIADVNALEQRLKKDGRAATAFHADLDPPQRDERMKLFKVGQIKALVASDVLARGMDVRAIRMVYNYDVPRSPELYLHRIGRCGRFQTKGVAVTLVQTPADKSQLDTIVSYFQTSVTQLDPDNYDLIDQLVKQALGKK